MNRCLRSFMCASLLTVLGVIPLLSCGGGKTVKKGDQFSAPDNVQKPVKKKSEVPGTLVNRVRIIVGDVPITDFDIASMERIIAKMPARGGKKKTAADELIERAIVDMEARAESLIVTDARIRNEVKRRMEAMNMTSESEFRKMVERETGLTYDAWTDDLRYQFVRSQLVQIKLTVAQPDEKEVEAYYQRNRDKVGLEVRYREIVFRPRGGSIAEESRVSQAASDVLGRVRGSSAAFAEAARTHPDNVSNVRFAGGLQDYTPLQDVAEIDRILAGVLFGLAPGQTSQVFRDGQGRYMIVRMEDRRPVSIQKVRPLILHQLYFEKEVEALDKWLERRKKDVAIQRID
ncbi:MAG: peptidyl-prolyl cis-trans isomerase [Spirochaetia bacterium]|nr:peptidyl-prolyl cis-trans isomerase [Spirochaetia bacterium]